jgi:uncharacterized protein
MSAPSRNTHIGTFLVFFLLLTTPIYALIVATGKIGSGTLIMWVPAEAALLTCAFRKLRVDTFGWSFRPVKYQVVGYLIPIAYALPVYLATWFLIPGSFLAAGMEDVAVKNFGLHSHLGLATSLIVIPVTATMGVISGMANALGEEIGWHGFLFPRLMQRFGFTVAALIHGTWWGLWHFPAILGADYSGGHRAWYIFAFFLIAVIGDAFIIGWLRMKSGSLWPAVIFHASHNLFIQRILDPSTSTTGFAPRVTSEFGFGMMITVWIFAFYFWKRRGELHQQNLSELVSTE